MADRFEYISKVKLEYKGKLRYATLGNVEEPVVYGVQGAMKSFYGVPETAPDIPATLDHMVGAVAGCMYGTAAGALVARGVKIDPSKFKATAEGKIEGMGRNIKITEIAIHYDLTIPEGTREEAERALKVHPQGCPAHESVKDCIKVTWTADIKEEAAVAASE